MWSHPTELWWRLSVTKLHRSSLKADSTKMQVVIEKGSKKTNAVKIQLWLTFIQILFGSVKLWLHGPVKQHCLPETITRQTIPDKGGNQLQSGWKQRQTQTPHSLTQYAQTKECFQFYQWKRTTSCTYAEKWRIFIIKCIFLTKKTKKKLKFPELFQWVS